MSQPGTPAPLARRALLGLARSPGWCIVKDQLSCTTAHAMIDAAPRDSLPTCDCSSMCNRSIRRTGSPPVFYRFSGRPRSRIASLALQRLACRGTSRQGFLGWTSGVERQTGCRPDADSRDQCALAGMMARREHRTSSGPLGRWSRPPCRG